MALERPAREAAKADRRIRLNPRIPGGPHILIASDDDALSEKLNIIFLNAGFTAERVRSMTEGCAAARSGRFQVIVTAPSLPDGSWERLVNVERHSRVGFVVVLVAKTFDLNQWAQALEQGAFEVLDALHELPRAAEAARRASWAAYLLGAGPRPESTDLPRAI